MQTEKVYSIEFDEEELQMVYHVFSRIESKCFAKWRSLCPEDGSKPSEECSQYWHLLGKVDDIKDRVAKPLGLSVRDESWE